jgi:hypothetical protein
MYKALVSFSGSISMSKGQVKEIKDKEIIKDLIKAKYIEEVPQEKEVKKIKKSV